MHSWYAPQLSIGNGPYQKPIPKSQIPNRRLVAVFASFERDHITHIAEGRMGPRAGTGMVQLQMRHFRHLARPPSFSEITRNATGRVRFHLGRYLKSGGVLPPKTREALLDVMIATDDTVTDWLNQLEGHPSAVARLGARAKENLALQKDAAGVALRIAGIEPAQLMGWRVGTQPRRSFLDGLPEARVREDAMIVGDAATIPGYDHVQDAPHFAARTFKSRRDPSNRMTIIMANRMPLEQQTGADLIYFNEEYRSFVMVQYKAMEEEASKAVFRWRPGDRFEKELDRMHRLLNVIKQTRTAGDHKSFRFSTNPFFLKFCPRVVLKPDATGLFRGMYVPLDLWDHLRGSGRLVGPRGGKMVTFENTERWMSNTEFINVVSKSWVGTSTAQSDSLEPVIKEVLTTGKTVTMAVKHRRDRGVPH